jgi:hypothetical protein
MLATRPITTVRCYHSVLKHIGVSLRFHHELSDWLCAGVLLVLAVLVDIDKTAARSPASVGAGRVAHVSTMNLRKRIDGRVCQTVTRAWLVSHALLVRFEGALQFARCVCCPIPTPRLRDGRAAGSDARQQSDERDCNEADTHGLALLVVVLARLRRPRRLTAELKLAPVETSACSCLLRLRGSCA